MNSQFCGTCSFFFNKLKFTKSTKIILILKVFVCTIKLWELVIFIQIVNQDIYLRPEEILINLNNINYFIEFRELDTFSYNACVKPPGV